MAHTPGPWRIEGHRGEGRILTAGVNQYGDGPADRVGIFYPEGNGIADTALIVAATDLLEALKGMKKAFGDPMTRRALGGHNDTQMAAVMAASTAIAKAEAR